jgi:hypothetical protein
MFSRLPFVVDEAILRFQVAGSNGHKGNLDEDARTITSGKRTLEARGPDYEGR